MSKRYRLNEVSKLLSVEVRELKKIIKSDTRLSSAKLNLVEMNKVAEKDLEILSEIFKKDDIKPKGVEIKMKKEFENSNPLFSVEELDNFKQDLVRAIYSGDKKSERLIMNLKNHLHTGNEDLKKSQDLILENNLTKMKHEFKELRAKLDRQSWSLDRMEMTIRKVENSVKRIENVQNHKIKTVKKVELETTKSPLIWYEKIFFQFFAPWKLRGRI
jgi:hypothetical protein